MAMIAFEWEYRLNSETWSTPAIVESAAHGRIILAVDRGGGVHAVTATGATLWTVTIGSMITGSPSSYRLSDGRVVVVIGAHNGVVYTLCADTGAILWSVVCGRCIRSTVAVADVDRDGKSELFVAAYGDWLVCLDGDDGSVHWRRYLPKQEARRSSGIVSSPLIADLDGDGSDELFVGTRSYRAYCLDARQGRLKWFRAFDYGVDSTASVAVIHNEPVVYVGGGEHLDGTGDRAIHALHGVDGSTIWRTAIRGGLDSSAVLADVNCDGRVELVQTSLADASCYALDAETGILVWSYRFGPTADCVHDGDNVCRPKTSQEYFTEHAICRSYTTPMIVDLNDDNQPEIVVGSINGDFVVLSGATGRLLHRERTAGPVRGSPVIGDCDGDGFDELLVSSGDRLLNYRTACRGADWPAFKGGPRHTGFIGRLPPVRTDRKCPLRVSVWARLLTDWLIIDTLAFIASQGSRFVPFVTPDWVRIPINRLAERAR